MKQVFTVHGMHCASCSAIISKKVRKLPGIVSCDINPATEKATITFDPSQVSMEKMNGEIQKLGYAFSPGHTQHNVSQHEMTDTDHAQHAGFFLSKEEKIKQLEALQVKVEFVVPIACIIFLFMMWDVASKLIAIIPILPIPMELFNTISFLLSSVILFWIGRPYIEAVVRFVMYRVANMDTLIGIGTLVAYMYSSSIFLFAPLRVFLRLPEYTYFDVTIVVIGFITLGKFLEARSKLQTGEAIEKLLTLQAKTAVVVRDGKEIEVPLSDVVIGDIVLVKPGGKIPVDGIIVEGKTAIDESMINGEPFPQDKKEGDSVIGATMNTFGSFRFQATNVGSDTMLAQIIRLVEASQSSKAPIQNLADAVSAVFIPVVLVVAVLAGVIWITVGSYFFGVSTAVSFGLLAFVGTLVIACPCALGLATPTAIIVGVGKGASYGILIKNAESLEKLHKVTTVVFDKTGTITSGKPTVTDIVVLDSSFTERTLVELTSSVEHLSGHPLAHAIEEKAKEQHIEFLPVTAFKEHEGIGVQGEINGHEITIGKPTKEEQLISRVNALQTQGKTVIAVQQDKKTIGCMAISDTIKPNAFAAIKKLHSMKIQTVMLTGDNKKAAEYIAHLVGIERVKAEVLPQDKSRIIQELQAEGSNVAMAGDGINDAPALSQADVGIAMATGTDIAIESSDITLLKGDIEKISQAIMVSKATIRTIKQNLFWAFIYNVVGIPLAAGLFYPIFGIFLNPVFAGMAMALSSVSVVGNSLLLKKAKI